MPDPQPGPPDPSAPRRNVILLAEDDLSLAGIYRRTLAKEGYEILHATDGMAALALAREHPPDLVLSDVMMPKMDGFKFCRLLKFDGRFKSIPFILMTARAEDRETGLKVGADEYLVKPVPLQDLLALVRKHLPGG